MSKQPLGFVIEDDANLAEIFSQSLETAGFAPEIIGNGQQALDRLKTAVPKLVILDLNLPKINGEQILQYIQDDARLKDTVVIVATANGTWGDMLHQRATLVLAKPISFIQLTSICQRYLNQSS